MTANPVMPLLAAILLAGCAGLPFRPHAPGDPWDEDAGAEPGPPPTGERDWSGFVALGAWAPSSDGQGTTPAGTGDGPDGDGSAVSLRVGGSWDLRPRGADGAPTGETFDWVPQGWRTFVGAEFEFIEARTSGSGADDPSLDLRAYRLIVPVGIRRPGPWPGADEHRFELTLGWAHHDLDLEDGDLAAVGADDSPSYSGALIGLRAAVGVGHRVFLFAGGEAGGETDDDLIDENEEGIAGWSAGAGIHLARGVTLRGGWRGLHLDSREEDRGLFLFVPVFRRVEKSRVDLSGPFLELVVSF